MAGCSSRDIRHANGGAATVEPAFRGSLRHRLGRQRTVFASLLLFCAMLMGGCTGSTAGGVKMFRIYILFEALKGQVVRLKILLSLPLTRAFWRG